MGEPGRSTGRACGAAFCGIRWGNCVSFSNGETPLFLPKASAGYGYGFFLTLKQEAAGTEPGDDEQAAGKFQQQAGKHPKRRSGTGPEGVHDILSGKDKFRQQRPQERHEQKAYDGGEKEAPRHGADDGSPNAGGSAAEFFGAHASGKLVNDHASRHQQRQDGPFPPRQVFSAHGSLPDAPGRNDDNSGKHGDERADQPHAE